MNKFVKGSIAAAAATVLLLGGAGSLAYWNSNADLAVGTVSTGELRLAADEGNWNAKPAKWVPGDSATFTTTLTLTAGGDNVRGTIALDESSITVAPAGADNPLDIVVAKGAGGTTPSGATLSHDASTSTFTFDGAGTYAVPVTVTVTFPYDDSTDGTAQNGSQGLNVNLDDLAFVATQTAP